MSKESQTTKNAEPSQCKNCDYYYPQEYTDKCAVLKYIQPDSEPCNIQQTKKQK